MSKIYEFKGKVYCEDDLSLERENYGGDLFWLFAALERNKLAYEQVTYIGKEYDEYEDYEDLIDTECEDMVIGETEQ